MSDIVRLVCDEKSKLWSAFQSASEVYSKAVRELSKSVGTASQARYERLHLAAEQARQRSIEARECYDGHTAEHRCLAAVAGSHS